MNLRYLKKYCLVVLIFIFLPFCSGAQDKFALIIGNNDYKGAYDRLPTCVNDANEMERCLNALGYTTTVLKNASRQEILNAFKAFDKSLKNNTAVGVFYYSGHATYIDDDYYLVPAKDVIEMSASLKNDCIDVRQIQTSLKKKCKYSFVFYDACRDFQKLEDLNKGLAGWYEPTNIDGGSGNSQLICYATGKGDVARTGTGSLSPFTKVLTSHLFDKESFAKIWNRKIMIEVPNLAKGQQPIIENTFDEDNVRFCFNEKGIKSIYDVNSNPDKVGVTINVYPKSKIQFGDDSYDSGTKLLFQIGNNYTFTVNQPGYEPYYGVIKAASDTPSVLDVKLVPIKEATFKIVCYKPKKALVYVDGEFKGSTSKVITTTTGSHNIKVSASKFNSYSTKLDLAPGDNGSYSVYLTRRLPDWLDYDKYDGAHLMNYHFSPRYQIGLSYMYRPESIRFSFGAMLASSPGLFRGVNFASASVSTGTSLTTSTTIDDGTGNMVPATIKTTTVTDDINNKYSSELDPYNEAVVHDANFLFLGNAGFSICNGFMIEAGVGGAFHEKRYYMPDTYIITKKVITNDLTGEMIGEPQYSYESRGLDKWYMGEDKWSVALRLGGRFFIPLDGFCDYSLTIGGGYTYLPTNHSYSSWDASLGFCIYF